MQLRDCVTSPLYPEIGSKRWRGIGRHSTVSGSTINGESVSNGRATRPVLRWSKLSTTTEVQYGNDSNPPGRTSGRGITRRTWDERSRGGAKAGCTDEPHHWHSERAASGNGGYGTAPGT